MLLFLWLTVVLSVQGAPTGCLPLKVAANGRYLMAGERPFFWLADTGWMMLSRLNSQETEQYLEDRRSKGFNVIQVMVLHSLAMTDAVGDSALVAQNVARPKNGSGKDGGGFWTHLDSVLAIADRKGLYLALVPVWGSNVKAGKVTPVQAEQYACFLAERYRNRPNIVWMNGGDIHGDDSLRVWQTIGATLKRLDPGHLITFHPFGRTQSSKWFHQEKWLDFNMFQSGHRDYRQDTSAVDLKYGEDNWRYLEADRRLLPAKPVLDGEPSYEGMPHGLHDTLQPKWQADDLRRYAYWSVFSGGCGFTYGHNSVMQFYSGGRAAGVYGARHHWQEAIRATGATQMIYLKSLMERYAFQNLSPRQDLIANQVDRYDHLVCLGRDKLWLIYGYTGRMIQLDRAKLPKATFRWQWFSPRTGATQSGGTTTKDQPLRFTPPDGVANGHDWVFILEQEPS